MKNRLISISIVGLLVIGGFAGLFIATDQVSAAGPIYVSGSITLDTTWYLADSPYIVIGDVTIESSATLTIEPGVEVKFNGAYSIIVDGKLIAQGTSVDKIKFTSNQTTPANGDWYTIRLRTENNLVDYAEIDYATYGVFMTYYGANNTVSNTTIKNCKYDGIYITNSDYNTISDCTVSSNDRYGITIYESHNTNVKESIIQYNNYFGIKLNASTYTQIYGCNISYNDGKGILLYSNSHHTTISDCQIDCNNHIGIDLSGTSNNNIINTRISGNNGIGIDFGGLTTNQCIDNCIIMDNQDTGIDLRGSSYVDIIDCNVSRNKGNGGIYSGNPINNTNITNTEVWSNLAGNGMNFYGATWLNITILKIIGNIGNGIIIGPQMSEDNVIKDCMISGNTGRGIYFQAITPNILANRNNISFNIISSNGKDGIYFYASAWYSPAADDNDIHHNYIYSNNGSGISFVTGACDSSADNNKIHDNYIYTNGQSGVYFYSYYHSPTNNNVIYNNDIYLNAQQGIHFFGCGASTAKFNKIFSNNIYSNGQNGIFIEGTSECTSMDNNEIYDNIIHQNNHNGIYFYVYQPSFFARVNDNLINYNTITYNKISGIYLVATKGGEVMRNTIYNCNISNNKYGISLENSPNNTIRYNYISNNNCSGINLNSSSSTNRIENNIIISNNQIGIFITQNSNNNLISRNDISTNSKVGLNITGASGNQIHHNNFKWNTQNAYDSTIALNDWDDGAEGNFWSDYLGTDDDGDGFGEDPYVISGGGSRDWHPFMNPLNIGNPPSYDIPLSIGWNLISLPLIQSNTKISYVLSSIAGNYDIVWWYNANDKKWHSTNSDLTDINHYMGLWIHMKNSDTLSVKGIVPCSTSIQLYKGWNLVGNPSSSTRPINETLAPIIDKCVAVQFYNSTDNADHWKHYHIGKPSKLNDLTYMTYGGGYWIYVSENCVWDISNL